MARFLLFGLGSIGSRHKRILEDLGHEVITVDPCPQAGANYLGIQYDDTLWLKQKHFQSNRLREIDGVMDCAPWDVRPTGRLIVRSAYFVEKPLGKADLTNVFWHSGAPVMVGFNYFWCPSLRDFVDSLASVRVYSLQVVGGSYLPNWHPDWRKRYHGQPGRGGVTRDSLPHSLFIARWILGDVRVVGSVRSSLSGLVRTDDVSAALLRSPTGIPCFVMADYLRQPGEFTVKAVTSDGVKLWEWDPAEADETYRRQMEAWVRVATGDLSHGFPDLHEGVEVEKLLLAIEGGNDGN